MVDDGRTTEHGYTISSPCEPDGSGELINSTILILCVFDSRTKFTLCIFVFQAVNPRPGIKNDIQLSFMLSLSKRVLVFIFNFNTDFLPFPQNTAATRDFLPYSPKYCGQKISKALLKQASSFIYGTSL